MKRLLALYPKRWRERYGAEIRSFIEREPPSLGLLWDLLRGAIDARMRPGLAVAGLVFAGVPGGAHLLPGVGFRPAGLQLPRPIVAERAGRSLIVRHVVVTPGQTDLIYDIVCSPSDCERIARRSEKVVLRDGAHEYQVSPERFQSSQAILGKVTRVLRLEPMPITVRQLELHVSSEILGDWVLPIVLEPYGPDLTADQVTPHSAETHSGITLTLRTAIFTGTETAVEIEAATDIPGLVFSGIGGLHSMRDGPTLLRLRDRAGHIYVERARPEAWGHGDPSEQTDTAIFEALSSGAVDLELEVPFVYVEDPTGRIELPLPATVPFSGTLGGNAVRIMSTRQTETTKASYRGPVLAVELDLGDWQRDRRVLKPRQAELDGVSTSIVIGTQMRATGPEPTSLIELPAENPLEVKTLRLIGATVQVRGPWRLGFARNA